MRAPAIILPAGVDPPTPPRRAGSPARFDPAPHRNRGMPACPALTPTLTNRIIAMAVDFGMPAAEAGEARSNPYVRWHVAQLACLIWDAAAGDKPARAALERIKFAFGNTRKVSEILAAYEQEPNPAELAELMGEG